jgi:glyoxylase-like metal-dependent hydrolase (beta-lactamase superfamily II)/8-oxo-dGTP pyrophosphatase MutT (NUDIX family)
MASTDSPQAKLPVQHRQAASLIVLRDVPGDADGPQVLLLRRADRPGDQNSGAVVFPGGVLDDSDRGHYERCLQLSDAQASARLGLASHGLHYWVAAIRECFEEAGLLFAAGADGHLVDLQRLPRDELTRLRRALHANQTGMAEVCDRFGVALATDRLAYFSHWITPVGLPKIFDTRFFIAVAPPGQTAEHDANELVDLLWISPAQALARAKADGLHFMNVTERTLQQLSRFKSAAEAVAWARAQTDVPLNRPRVGIGAKGRTAVNIDHWAYAELGRVDPEGRGQSRVDLAPGHPVWLSPRVLRVTAPNGSLMTGPGTNSYFIGAPSLAAGERGWALLDPGPDDAAHVQALLAAAPGPITRILVTHTHKDHSPAAAAIARATGAPSFGLKPTHPEWQDNEFDPVHTLADGDRLDLGPGTTLRVVHTPGHASNHLCYLLEEEKLLFTGDHLMQGSTVVINPPDGDMVAYLASLERLLDFDLAWLAPGHGFLIDQPHAVVRKTVAHRLGREAKVLSALQRLAASRPAHEDELLAEVYADTPAALHSVARRSLRAHLLKLAAEKRARAEGALHWQAAA